MLDILKNKQTAYRKTFGGEIAKVVLADLRRFCHATKTTITNPIGQTAIDPLQVARLEGRREVFLQIMQMIKVDFEEVYEYLEDDYEV